MTTLSYEYIWDWDVFHEPAVPRRFTQLDSVLPVNNSRHTILMCQENLTLFKFTWFCCSPHLYSPAVCLVQVYNIHNAMQIHIAFNLLRINKKTRISLCFSLHILDERKNCVAISNLHFFFVFVFFVFHATGTFCAFFIFLFYSHAASSSLRCEHVLSVSWYTIFRAFYSQCVTTPLCVVLS